MYQLGLLPLKVHKAHQLARRGECTLKEALRSNVSALVPAVIKQQN